MRYPCEKVIASRVGGVALLLIVLLTGCTSSQDEDSTESRPVKSVGEQSIPAVRGVALLHLTPLTPEQERQANLPQALPEFQTPPESPQNSTSIQALKVSWVIDGPSVRRPAGQPVPVNKFRLDFDVSKPIDYGVLPYAYMTENSHQIVIRRGNANGFFIEPEISSTERCFPIFECLNLACPRFAEIGHTAIFPFNFIDDKLPVCPWCKSHDADRKGPKVRQYKTSQHGDMERLMSRRLFIENFGGSTQ